MAANDGPHEAPGLIQGGGQDYAWRSLRDHQNDAIRGRTKITDIIIIVRKIASLIIDQMIIIISAGRLPLPDIDLEHQTDRSCDNCIHRLSVKRGY